MPADVAYQPGDADDSGLNRRVQEWGSRARRMPSNSRGSSTICSGSLLRQRRRAGGACAAIGSSVSRSRSALSGPAMLAVMAERRTRQPPGRPPGRWTGQHEAWQLTAAPGPPFPLPRSEPGVAHLDKQPGQSSQAASSGPASSSRRLGSCRVVLRLAGPGRSWTGRPRPWCRCWRRTVSGRPTGEPHGRGRVRQYRSPGGEQRGHRQARACGLAIERHRRWIGALVQQSVVGTQRVVDSSRLGVLGR